MHIRRTMLIGLASGLFATATTAHHARAASDGFTPVTLSLQQQQHEPDSVYEPPVPRRPDEGVNEGGVHFDVEVGYFTSYVYRGVEVFDLPQFNPIPPNNNANLQIDAKLSWDLGKLPHPFVGVFANVTNSDPISTFEEIRPIVGFDWTLRPFIFSAGYTSYIYPDRDSLETSEVWGIIALDDSYFLKSDKPLLSPYVLVAYDIDLYNGWYIEAGVKHDFPIEDTGLTITLEACIAYVQGYELYATTPGQNVSGFQHYQLGLIGDYSLNKLLNVPARYGEWSFIGYLYYTDGIDNDLLADTLVWGGAGIRFKY